MFCSQSQCCGIISLGAFFFFFFFSKSNNKTTHTHTHTHTHIHTHTAQCTDPLAHIPPSPPPPPPPPPPLSSLPPLSLVLANKTQELKRWISVLLSSCFLHNSPPAPFLESLYLWPRPRRWNKDVNKGNQANRWE